MATWSGLWNREYNENYSLLVDRNPKRKSLTKAFRRKSMRVLSEQIKTLLDDSTPASTALVQRSRVAAGTPDPGNPVVNGGARTIEAQDLINTAVTAAMVTDIQRLVQGGTELQTAPGTYATDSSGNGGGGKLGLI